MSIFFMRQHFWKKVVLNIMPLQHHRISLRLLVQELPSKDPDLNTRSEASKAAQTNYQ